MQDRKGDSLIEAHSDHVCDVGDIHPPEEVSHPEVDHRLGNIHPDSRLKVLDAEKQKVRLKNLTKLKS